MFGESKDFILSSSPPGFFVLSLVDEIALGR
jgi:hypothetical protein